MSDIFDENERSMEDRVEIVNKEINIISFDDLVNKIEYQFNPMVEIGIDNNDYMKWFMLNVCKCPEEEFPTNFMFYINEDNKTDYNNMLSVIEYNMRKRLGITVDEEDNKFLNVYNLYYFFIVSPETLIVDFLLTYNYYKEPRHIFKNFYKDRILTNNIPTFDIRKFNPVEIVSGVKTQYAQQGKAKDFEMLSYKEKMSSFIAYVNYIFMDNMEFNFINLFKNANQFSNCANYEMLDDQINILFNIRYEDIELIRSFLLDVIMNPLHREVYLQTKIVDVFFKTIRDFEVTMSSTLNY
ncbi:MAG: hypothetical protein ACRC5M_04705 [Anaeroplasmataceae bacterium]